MTEFELGSLDHVHVFVPDREAAADWYVRTLGFEAVHPEWAEDPRGPLTITADGGRTAIALFAGDPGQVRHRTVAFRVDAATFLAFARRLEAEEFLDRDGQRVTPGDLEDHDASLSFYFADPWGNSYELTTYDAADARAALPL